MMFGKRILILVPHPDDEVVACAAAIGRAREAGAEIFALYLTHGCIAREVMWAWQRKNYQKIIARRRAEAEEAARLLGLKPAGWSLRPARHLWREMDAVCTEIQAAITSLRIDQIWLPAYEGGNPDHDALNAIGQKFKTSISVLEFAEYNFCGGRVRANRFPKPNGSEQVIEMTKSEAIRKVTAQMLYESEGANLNYVSGVAHECFRPLADYDYSRPPHSGKLWYARFQWVPFRHPRVDFTDPAEVSEAIKDFMQQEGK